MKLRLIKIHASHFEQIKLQWCLYLQKGRKTFSTCTAAVLTISATVTRRFRNDENDKPMSLLSDRSTDIGRFKVCKHGSAVHRLGVDPDSIETKMYGTFMAAANAITPSELMAFLLKLIVVSFVLPLAIARAISSTPNSRQS